MGRWRQDEDQITFSSQINDKDCRCTARSSANFWKRSSTAEVKLVARNKNGRDIIKGLKYHRSIKTSVGKCIYGSVSIDDLEGSIGELYVSDYYDKSSTPFTTSGPMEASTIDSFKVAYAATKRFLSLNKVSKRWTISASL